ncbi:hypothetical protein GF336_02465 [Candidatus Woesearchaeota archaeon]|nr:hypothetical protein [Candidatus Woesearchaeota archaeon]
MSIDSIIRRLYSVGSRVIDFSKREAMPYILMASLAAGCGGSGGGDSKTEEPVNNKPAVEAKIASYGTNAPEVTLDNNGAVYEDIQANENLFSTLRDLMAGVSASDADGDALSFEINWQKYNDDTGSWEDAAEFDNLPEIPAASLSGGEQWRYNVTVSDGKETTEATSGIASIIEGDANLLDIDESSIPSTATEGDAYTAAINMDDPLEGAMTFQLNDAPAGVTAQQTDNNTYVITWTPDYAQGASGDSYQFSVTGIPSNTNYVNSDTETWTVLAYNTPELSEYGDIADDTAIPDDHNIKLSKNMLEDLLETIESQNPGTLENGFIDAVKDSANVNFGWYKKTDGTVDSDSLYIEISTTARIESDVNGDNDGKYVLRKNIGKNIIDQADEYLMGDF